MGVASSIPGLASCSGFRLERVGLYNEACRAYSNEACRAYSNEACRAYSNEAVAKTSWKERITHQRELNCLQMLDYWGDIESKVGEDEFDWRIDACAMQNDYESVWESGVRCSGVVALARSRAPECLSLHQLVLYGRGLLLRQELDALDALFASFPALLLPAVSASCRQPSKRRNVLFETAQELYDLKEMALLFSSSVPKSQKLERMAALRQNLPADYESCSMWRDVLYWREHAFSKLDTLSYQDDHQIMRGDVEWCGLRLIERFVAASNTVGVVRLANELLQRKWLSVSTVMLLESVMASQANSHAFAFDRELFSCANPWMLDPKDKALAFMSLVDTKTGTDTQERRKELLSLCAQAMLHDPNNAAMWERWSILLQTEKMIDEQLIAIVASLEKGSTMNAWKVRTAMTVLNRIILKRMDGKVLEQILEQCPSFVFLPFLPFLFSIYAQYFSMLKPVRKMIQRDYPDFYAFYITWMRSVVADRNSRSDEAFCEVGL